MHCFAFPFASALIVLAHLEASGECSEQKCQHVRKALRIPDPLVLVVGEKTLYLMLRYVI